MPKTVACPVCRAPVAWNPDSPWRPFCSERCKTIDLGDWASEQHVIAGRAGAADDSPARDEDASREH
jgi:endogenous inhibitor of DNA gyrase (YacG/DUF329 family)